MSPDETNDDTDVLSTNAHIAVGLLSDAIGPDTYHGRDVDEAKGQLRAVLEDTTANTEATERIETALEYLAEMDSYALDERRLKVRDALAELAPVAAGVADHGRLANDDGRQQDEKPTVPVLYHVPPAAVDRAIHRFKRRRANNPTPGRRTYLKEYIYDGIDERPVIYVGDEPLAEYASGRVESMVIEPDGERDT